MSATLRELAELVQGALQGDGNLSILAARPLDEAQPGDVTFVEDARHGAQLPHSRASAAIVPTSFQGNGVPLIRVADPLAAFIAIVRRLHGRPEPPPHGIDPRAAVHPTAVLGDCPSVHPFAVIGEGTVIGARCRIHPGVSVGRNCRLGDDVTLFPNVAVYDDTIIGQRVTVHANAVLGADGFGYRFHGGRHVKVPQLGRVEIGDDVEIGAGTTVDRATFGTTHVGEGTKIDNQVQIAHNCRIGRHNLLVSQVGIAGSSTTGNHVVMAGQVGVVGHVHIGDRAVIGAQAGVRRDVPPGERVLGTPALPESLQKRIWVSFDKLPEIRRDVGEIKKRLGMTG